MTNKTIIEQSFLHREHRHFGSISSKVYQPTVGTTSVQHLQVSSYSYESTMADLIIFLILFSHYDFLRIITYYRLRSLIQHRKKNQLVLVLLVTFVNILFSFPYNLNGQPLRLQFLCSVCSSSYITVYYFMIQPHWLIVLLRIRYLT